MIDFDDDGAFMFVVRLPLVLIAIVLIYAWCVVLALWCGMLWIAEQLAGGPRPPRGSGS